MLEVLEREGLDLIVSPLLEEERHVRVSFSDRNGGVGTGRFASLNLSYNVGDDPSAVKSNRSRLGDSTGVPTGEWVLCQQVHGTCVMEVGPLEVGRGGSDFLSAIPRCDGLVTDLPGVALGVLTADCVPVLMATPGGRAVAAVHQGWKGALAGVAAVALRKLCRVAACRPEEVVSVIGPYIGPCCMEVEYDLARRFRTRFGRETVTDRGSGGVSVDLGAACRVQLIQAGAEPVNLFVAGICTRCDDRYFSFRGSSGVTGRQAGVVSIVDGNGRGRCGDRI